MSLKDGQDRLRWWKLQKVSSLDPPREKPNRAKQSLPGTEREKRRNYSFWCLRPAWGFQRELERVRWKFTGQPAVMAWVQRRKKSNRYKAEAFLWCFIPTPCRPAGAVLVTIMHHHHYLRGPSVSFYTGMTRGHVQVQLPSGVPKGHVQVQLPYIDTNKFPKVKA